MVVRSSRGSLFYCDTFTQARVILVRARTHCNWRRSRWSGETHGIDGNRASSDPNYDRRRLGWGSRL
ncbi:MAG: hypothetical protein SWY16_03770 [Cyanobacteriota bacterium]|nr:hypothetical protein [Cyanobacteriota bacterium]